MVNPRKTSSDLSRSRVSEAIVSSAFGGDQIDLGGGPRVVAARLLPAIEDHRDHAKEVQPAGDPHRPAAEPLIFHRRKAHDTRRTGIKGMEERARRGDRSRD